MELRGPLYKSTPFFSFTPRCLSKSLVMSVMNETQSASLERAVMLRPNLHRPLSTVYPVCLPANQPQYLVEQQAVGAHALAAVDRRVALPVGVATARLAQNR